MNQRTVPNLGVPPSHTAHEIAQQPALWRQVDADPATESARAFAQELLRRRTESSQCVSGVSRVGCNV